MGQGVGAIERARTDVAEGRPWKARERLRSFVNAHPTDQAADQAALELLGQVLTLPFAAVVAVRGLT